MKKLLFLLPLFLLSFIPTSNKEVLLQVNLTRGENIPVSAKIISMTKMMGMNTGIEIGIDYDIKCVGKSADLNKVENNFKHIKMNMVLGALGNISIDSDKLDDLDTLGPQGAQMKHMMEGMLKSKITFDISGRGEVSNTEFYVPEGYDIQAMDPNTIKQNLEQSFMTFPKKPVTVGTKWTEDKRYESTLVYNQKATYEVVEITGKIVKLKVDGDITADEGQTLNGINISNFQGNMKGETTLDIQHGVVKLATAVQNLTFDLKREDQTIPVKTINKIAITADL